jgi:hypothetical protein
MCYQSRRRTASLASLAVAFVLSCGTETAGTIAGAPALSRASSFSAWSEPVAVSALNTTGNDQQATFSNDGLTMFFASTRDTPGVLDLFVTHRPDLESPWSAAVNLGPGINTAAGEFAPALSRDGHWLFFASGRPGGFGSVDIWASWRRDVHDDFGWEAPVNLGPGVNTTGFDAGPGYFDNEELGVSQLFYNHNDQPVNTGGAIYVSVRNADGSWGTGMPVAELNSSASQQRPSVHHSGLDVYFFSNRPGSFADGTGALTTDVWIASREAAVAPWSPPTNLGAPISTGIPEVGPTILARGGIEELYFSRTMPGTGNDLFVTRRTRRAM